MMTKKDLIAIAEVIRKQRRMDNSGAQDALLDIIIAELADVCENSNPNFDRDRFLLACVACGVEP